MLLPLAPVPAARPRMTQRGITYYPKTHNEFKKQAIAHLEEHYDTDWQFDGPCELHIEIVVQRPKTGKFTYPVRGDLDNFVKLPMDCLSSARPEGDGKDGRRIAWLDDRQVVKMYATKRYNEPGEEPYIHMKVFRL